MVKFSSVPRRRNSAGAAPKIRLYSAGSVGGGKGFGRACSPDIIFFLGRADTCLGFPRQPLIKSGLAFRRTLHSRRIRCGTPGLGQWAYIWSASHRGLKTSWTCNVRPDERLLLHPTA